MCGGGVLSEKFAVRLTPEERYQLEHMVRAGKSPTRVTTRARILLKTDEGWSASRVAQYLGALDKWSGVFPFGPFSASEGMPGGIIVQMANPVLLWCGAAQGALLHRQLPGGGRLRDNDSAARIR